MVASRPVLAAAGAAGELLVAKIRLFLATILLLIPVIDSFFFTVEPKEASGEEFVVVMPETDIETAQQKLESLRDLIAQTPLELKSRSETVNVTISAGLATFPHDGASEVDLYALADERLFQAKREGRNRVVASPETVLA